MINEHDDDGGVYDVYTVYTDCKSLVCAKTSVRLSTGCLLWRMADGGWRMADVMVFGARAAKTWSFHRASKRNACLSRVTSANDSLVRLSIFKHYLQRHPRLLLIRVYCLYSLARLVHPRLNFTRIIYNDPSSRHGQTKPDKRAT